MAERGMSTTPQIGEIPAEHCVEQIRRSRRKDGESAFVDAVWSSTIGHRRHRPSHKTLRFSPLQPVL